MLGSDRIVEIKPANDAIGEQYVVRSFNSKKLNDKYEVFRSLSDGRWICTCPRFQFVLKKQKKECKHIEYVRLQKVLFEATQDELQSGDWRFDWMEDA